MNLSEFDFPFDPSLVADRPVQPRDRARLLLVHRDEQTLSHHHVADLPALLRPGDLLVVNDTKVLPVRLTGRKIPGGGKIELLLIRELEQGIWEALLKGGGKPGQIFNLAQDASATVIRSGEHGAIIQISSGRSVRDLLQQIGQMPLPPYIKRAACEKDRGWYQTVFARSEGAVAAPTAGLHFTEALVSNLQQKGIHIASVTLHVGPGTFRPVRSNRVEDHPMPPESIEVSQETTEHIHAAKDQGRRVVAVGTTVVRTLEKAGADGIVKPMKGETNLFILPGYQFRIVDALLTNFHLPCTTLVMLVSAFAGSVRMRQAYEEAIRERYRFYSYGDAMLIL
ncbi:MAG TPA: tRNA preQ1(34) S-adenosylmethionine ribosyltransferase-isomerase QueA [Nitrospiraceae bacterium]|nr:tRNA preQ1(34) S-adenosylmethionine ribosyltransferase-isomerase QueA [Nitrospiraceae bacterium]